ncbi:MAG: hypothetical protein LBN21_06080 [Treponema sp.]|jgi:hypothetical protein|nr:hypothetical protein [Treponema sp.]
MKNIWKVFFGICIAVLFIPSAAAQTGSLTGQSLNGAAGLYSIPLGRIGWGRTSDLGIDIGYHAVINDYGGASIPAVTASLFKWVEISIAFDIQPDFDRLVWYNNDWENIKNDDMLLGFKVALPTNISDSSNPAVAIGGNVQLINFADDDYDNYFNIDYTAFQIYGAATYAGSFFKMPAETTIVLGKTFYAGIDNNSDIDFGMGFDLVLLPDVFQNYIHWIIDFANFDYSDNSWPNSVYAKSGAPWYRGILNTGLRIDLANIPALNKFKFIIDVEFKDLFDEGNRAFAIGLVFGMPIL